MKSKTLAILALLTVVGAGAAYIATRSGSSQTSDSESAGAPVFPTLSAKANDVAEIVIQRPEMTFTIKRDGDTWRVVDKANYPAKIATVRSFIISLTQLRELEAKTSKPELYSKLGVEDPVAPPLASSDKPTPRSTLVTLKDAKGDTIAVAILGNSKPGTSPGIFIRRVGEQQAWLADGRIDLQREPMQWLESQFANIRRERVKSVVITHPPPGSETVSVDHEHQADKIMVKDIPAGRELKDPGVGDAIASTLTGLTLQDVAPIASIDFTGGPEGNPGPSIELRTFDGLIVNVQTVSKDGRGWWKLVASVDESIAAQVPPAPAEASEKAAAATTPEALRKEAADLNAKWSAYAFAPVDWKAKSVNNTMGDLLKELPAATLPAAAPGSSTPPVPAPPQAQPVPEQPPK